jgi:hypothetical protein
MEIEFVPQSKGNAAYQQLNNSGNDLHVISLRERIRFHYELLLIQLKSRKYVWFGVQYILPCLIMLLAWQLSFALYETTLEKCGHNVPDCYRIMEVKVYGYVAKVTISVLIYTFSIITIGLRYVPWPMLFILPYYFYKVHTVSLGWDLNEHGRFNEIIFFAVLTIVLFVKLLIFIIYRIVKRFGKKAFFVIIPFALFCIVYFNYRIDHSCEQSDFGLKGTKILENGKLCKLRDPQICLFDVTNNLLDASKLPFVNEKYGPDELMKPTYGDSKLIGYPDTRNYTHMEMTIQNFYDTTCEGLKLFENSDEFYSNKSDVMLNRTGEHPKIQINITREDALINRSITNEANMTTKPLVKNVLSIFLDAVSRKQFMRKFQKTQAWLEKYYDNKLSPMESFQFFRYQSVDRFTSPTVRAALTGTELNVRLGTHITKYMKERGVITGFSLNQCSATHYDFADTDLEKEGKESPAGPFEPADAINTAMFCDLTFQNHIGFSNLFKGPYSIFRRYLYGRDTFEYVIEYGEQFWETYLDRPKYFDFAFIDGHEPTGEVVKYLDEPLVNLLERMESKGWLNDTAIIIYADHGLHPNFLMFIDPYESERQENMLPAMFFILPREIADVYGDTLKQNEQKLIGSFDVYNTLLTWINHGEPSPNGQDLMNVVLNETRACSDLHIQIPECYCPHEV